MLFSRQTELFTCEVVNMKIVSKSGSFSKGKIKVWCGDDNGGSGVVFSLALLCRAVSTC